MVENIKIIY